MNGIDIVTVVKEFNMKPLFILDKHRQAWEHLLGQRRCFRATVNRFGHRHRQGAKIKKGATLCVTDVHLKGSKYVIDHVWLDYTVDLAVFGERLKPGTLLEFTAVVITYEKGGKNIYGQAKGTYQDFGLADVNNCQIIQHPRYRQSDLIGPLLISYAIKSHTNINSGKFLGYDPLIPQRKIYVGQTFANHLAKFLSWKWSNKQP